MDTAGANSGDPFKPAKPEGDGTASLTPASSKNQNPSTRSLYQFFKFDDDAEESQAWGPRGST